MERNLGDGFSVDPLLRVVLASGVLISVLLLSGLGLPGVLRADVLVTTDGQKIETQGPYEVDGRRIVYHNPDGVLMAVRASSIDLEASSKATEDAKRPPPPPEAPEPEKQLDVVELSRQGKIGDAALVLESDTASGPRGDEISRQLSAVFDALPIDPATRQRLKKKTDQAIRGVVAALSRHDVTTRAGTRAAARDIRKVERDLRSYARQERDPALGKYFDFVAGEIAKLAWAADRGPEALAAAL